MILYKSNERNFDNQGLGVLINTVNSVVVEELNGAFELTFTCLYIGLGENYEQEKMLFENVLKDAIVKVKVDNRPMQLFRIDSVNFDSLAKSKHCHAMHITYDLLNNLTEVITATNISCQNAMTAVLNSAVLPHRFTATSDFTSTNNIHFQFVNPINAFKGMEYSILSKWRGEFIYNNFNIALNRQRGVQSTVVVQYRKNLAGLEITDETTPITMMIPYAIITIDEKEQLIRIPQRYIVSPLHDEHGRVISVDYSSEMRENEFTTAEQLLSLSESYFVETQADIVRLNIEIDFIDLSQTVEYIDFVELESVNLGDFVTVYHPKYNINLISQVVKREILVSCLGKYRVTNLTLGNTRTNLSEDINNQFGNILGDVARTVSSANARFLGVISENENHLTEHDVAISDLQKRVEALEIIIGGDEDESS